MAEQAAPSSASQPSEGPLIKIKVKTLQPATHEVEIPNNVRRELAVEHICSGNDLCTLAVLLLSSFAKDYALYC